MGSTLTIRRLDDQVKERLRLAAARSGHSMEEEARQILGRALLRDRPRVGLATTMRDLFRDADVEGFVTPERSSEIRDPFG